MSKLSPQKDWLTTIETAKSIALTIGEEVSEADVLKLGLDGKLPLSVNFVNGVVAREGRRVLIDQTTGLTNGNANVTRAVQFKAGELFVFDGDDILLDGVWDLPLEDGDRLEIERKFFGLTNGPKVTRDPHQGVFVSDGKGQIFQLLSDEVPTAFRAPSGSKVDEFPQFLGDSEIDKRKREVGLMNFARDLERKLKGEEFPAAPENFAPAKVFRSDALIGIRSTALRAFEQAQNKELAPTVDKPILTIERNSLLVIIAALCNYSNIKYGESGAAGQIAGMIDEIGARLSEDTVLKWLKEIPNALETRMK